MADNKDNHKPTFTSLARRLGRLPADKKRIALEMSAALAGVSLRVSRQFVEAVPQAAKILSADELKLWGELGRRLAMGDANDGAEFFAEGVKGLSKIPAEARTFVFQICTKQLVLSSSTATGTFRFIPRLADSAPDKKLLTAVLRLASDVAQRSAKHSADLLQHTPAVIDAIGRFGDDRGKVADAMIAFASNFAERTGGLAAELWQELPDSLNGLSAANAVRLMRNAERMLDLGGSVTMNFVTAGSSVLRSSEDAFDDWSDLVREIGGYGNAILISFLRATPNFFHQLSAQKATVSPAAIRGVLSTITKIAKSDAESALAAFKSSSSALRDVTAAQFDEWVSAGLADLEDGSSKARRSYFALETRESKERLHRTRRGLPLDRIQPVLRMYIEALTGKEVEIAPLSQMPSETRIGDGKTIYLPSAISEFNDDDMDFRLFKVLAAHGAGQIEFGTFLRDTTELKAVYAELSDLYSATAVEKDAFSLGGYIDDLQRAEPASPNDDPSDERTNILPPDSDHRAVIGLFPEPRLARKIFGTVENARIDRCLRQSYRGLRRDLDLMQEFLRRNRPYIFDVPIHQVPFELLFQIALCGGATDDALRFYGQVVSEINAAIELYLDNSRVTVADSLMATSRIYSLFQNISSEQIRDEENESTDDQGKFAYQDKGAGEAFTEDPVKREPKQDAQDISDLFNAWNELDDEGEPDDLQGSEMWSQGEVLEQGLEADDIAFAYDEWDRELNDYRVGWSRVIEKKVKTGDRTFVELTRSRHRGVISSIRHQFELMKPENLTRINREIDGEDYDLNAVVDLVIDRRADGRQAENIYTKRLRKQRDVAVSFLLDQSSSTARTITRNPLQPYTHPGRRIIEIEKEGLVLMSEALEAVGDLYSINGFTSEGRRNVKFYIVKDFHEKYSDEIEKRIGGITFKNNTRLGAAIRHASSRLLRQESRTKLLIILTDGRPYDHDYGDARYAREDVREALIEAKTNGVTPFCITIDRESESELRDLYGDVGYTIIDDVLSLPERMPNIYRRLTS